MQNDFTEYIENKVTIMRSALLEKAGGVTHTFTTRYGGVSTGEFESLNLAVSRGDDRAHVSANYNILCGILGICTEKLVFSRQVHGSEVRPVTSADSKTDLFASVPYAADGIMTNEPGLPLIIHLADCEGILLYDPVCRAIAAIHAGWRGTVAGIAEKAVARMADTYGCRPENILAALAPCAGKCCYEVGEEVLRAARDSGIDCGELIAPADEGKGRLDIRGLNAAILKRAGVLEEHISASDECTMCRPEKYWSHRKTGGKRGAQACIISMI